MDPVKRIARIKELQAKGKAITKEEAQELIQLVKDQTVWGLQHPAEAIALKASATEPVPTVLPTLEEAKVAAGNAAREKALREGKSKAEADTIALEAYKNYSPATTAAADASNDTASRNYQALGEAYGKDVKGFAYYLLDLADKGELVGSNGQRLPMYTKEQIDAMTPQQLQTLVDNNPGYAAKYFGETPEKIEGKYTVGVGESNQVLFPEKETATAPAPTTAATTKATTTETADKKEELPPEPPKANATPPKTVSEKMATLADWGVPILGIIEAIGKQRGKVEGPTVLDKRYAEAQAKREQEFMANLEKEKEARLEEIEKRKTAASQQFASEQSALERAASESALNRELAARERIAKMQIDAANAAGRSSGTASIIPE